MDCIMICPSCITQDAVWVETGARYIWSVRADVHGRPNFSLIEHVNDEEPDEYTPASCTNCGYEGQVEDFIRTAIMCPACEANQAEITMIVYPDNRDNDQARCEACGYSGSDSEFIH